MTVKRSKAKVTTNHEEIRRWVESRGGSPARVKSTGRANDPGILRIDYPGFRGVDTLVKMSWSEWFDAFDKKRLAVIYEPNTRFSKLVSRDTLTASASTRATPRRATGAKRAAAKRPSAKRATTKSPARKTTTRRGATSSRAGAKRTSTAKRGAPTRGATRGTTRRTTTKRGGVKRVANKRA